MASALTRKISGYFQQAYITAYMEFIFDRLKHKNPDGSLQIMSVSQIFIDSVLTMVGLPSGTLSMGVKSLKKLN